MQFTLRNTSAVAVVDTHGAELKSFQDGFGTEYLWQGDPAYWSASSPVLFPVVSSLRGGKTLIDGREYEIPLHGFAHSMEFRSCYFMENKAVFSLIANEKTKAMYPFDFNLQISYELDACTLKIRYDVFNMGDRTMPFCLGAHPGFNIPLAEDDVFENYRIRFAETEEGTTPIFDPEKREWQADQRVQRLEDGRQMKLRYDLFEKDAVFFDTLRSSKLELSSQLTGRGVQVELEGFESVAFWTPAGKQAPFLCIEPWCGAAAYSDEGDEFVKKRGVQFVEPDEKKTYAMTIEMM